MSSIRLMWFDLESTGLDPKTDAILAIGVHFTDAFLRPLSDPFEVILNATEQDLAPMLPVVREMHTKSGLLTKVASSDAVTFERAEHDLLDFITSNTQVPKETYLAGSSIHFDRSFLAEQMPLVLEHVSHRMLDVSAFKVFATGWGLRSLPGTPQHMPLADIMASQAELKHWVAAMFRPAFTIGMSSRASDGPWKRG